MALTKVIGNGLGTLGDGTANDTKIVFDGNAQDYHIGLDDSADTLVIGKGSALGTTTSMSFDENGAITKPLQPAFLIKASGGQQNISTGSLTEVQWNGTEVFDQNADFASHNFTAPVTGRYQFNAHMYLNAVDTGADYYQLQITTSNRNYPLVFTPNFSSDLTYHQVTLTMLADMDANDTASIGFYQGSGTAQTDIDGGSYFSGYLVC